MKNRTLLIILAVVTILVGFFAILNPLAGSIAVTLIAGWAFLLLGALQIIAVFRETDWSHRLWSLLLAALAILAGIGLLLDPLSGVISLAYLLAILFLVSGLFKIAAALGMLSGQFKWLVLLSGAVSIVLAAMIFGNVGGAALTALGLLLGFQLISDGASLLGLALAAPRVGGA